MKRFLWISREQGGQVKQATLRSDQNGSIEHYAHLETTAGS